MSKINAANILNKVIKYGDDLAGFSKRRLNLQADILYKARNLGKKGVPYQTISHARDLADKASKDSFKARAVTLAGATAVGTAGMAGVNYHYKQKENKILQRLDTILKKD